MNSNRQQLAAGTLIGGRYSIVRLIGQGGMAHVYLATDQQGGASVAVKVMKSDLTHDQEFIKRFDTEARAASSLDHPNIVKVLGFGQDGDLRYIVQELVEGPTLKDLIQEHGALDWEIAVPLVIQIGLALEHAHRRGVVHRDIKPHNILITKDMVAKVTDFGIARAVSANTITLTSGMTFGSVHYFSPEQARGSIVSEKSDIYSLGIMLYEMVTGQVPFDGETSVAIAIKHLQEMPPLPSAVKRGIPSGLDNIIKKCIQKSPENRYLDARELVDELDAFMIDPVGIYGVLANNDYEGNTSALGLKRPEPNFGKLREIEKTINDRRRSRQRDIGIVVGIILLSLIFMISIGAWAYQKLTAPLSTDADTEYTIPYFVGQAGTDVEIILTEAGIKFKLEAKPSPTVAAGLITNQDPAAGTKIRVNGTTILILTVSSGQQTTTLKDYSNKTYASAKADLESLGFVVNMTEEPSDVFEPGKVIKSNPAAGELVLVGSQITLVVCGGGTNVTVPSLFNLSFQVATDLCNSNHLPIGKWISLHVDPITGVPIDLPEAERVVIKQSIAPDTVVPYQTVIILTYGNAQDLFNFLNPTPTPEPPTPTPEPPTPTPEPPTPTPEPPTPTPEP